MLPLRMVTFVVLVQPGDVEQPKPSGLGGIDWALARDKLSGTLAPSPHS